MGGKKKYAEMFGSFTEPFNLRIFWTPQKRGSGDRSPPVGSRGEAQGVGGRSPPDADDIFRLKCIFYAICVNNFIL